MSEAAGEQGSPVVDALRRVTARLPSGESRAAQEQMCDAVATALASGRHLVVQAGTGTGKSLAYVVPAALSGKQVVIATATKALQDQLAKKDLPLVQSTLAEDGHHFSFSVLKGRSNYLCRQRVAEIGGGLQPTLDDAGTEAAGGAETAETGDTDEDADTGPTRLADQVLRLVRWADETESGDQAELEFEPHPRAWAMVSVGPRECPGQFHCPSGSTCFAEAARSAATSADLVVVNTHLYGSHLASGGAVLPEHDAVVFDEAHALEDVMSACLGVEITPGRFRSLATAARSLPPPHSGQPRTGTRTRAAKGNDPVDDVADIGQRLDAVLGARIGRRVLHDHAAVTPETGARTTGARTHHAGDPGDPGDPELLDILSLASSRLRTLMGALRAAPPTATRLDLGGPGDPAETAADDDARRARAVNAAGHLLDDLDRVLTQRPDDVTWVDGTTRAPVLRLSPVDVGNPLVDLLWPEVTGILTSATIPVGLAHRVGLDREAGDGDEPAAHTDDDEWADSDERDPDRRQPPARRSHRTSAPNFVEIDVGSPFDYRAQSLLYVARHLPDRSSADAEAAIHDELEALITAAGGRTLALFTSRRAMEAAALELRGRLDLPVLVQDDLPKQRLLRQFAGDEATSLFATIGLWQGVDVVGRSLSLVTLDRLPFARPDDPLMQARRDLAGPAAFRTVDLPRAATLLAQGAGRLIRSAEDRGVVAVLDPRLATAGYRNVLLSAVPPMRRTTDRRQVVDFLRRILPVPAS